MDDLSDTGTGSPDNLKFTYQKGNYYRVIHVDGAHGSIAPSGRYVSMALYSERRTIPREVVFPFNQDGGVAPEEIKGRTIDIGGVFREIEACAIMDIVVAKSLHKWLGERIEEHGRVMDAIRKHREAQSGQHHGG